MSTEPFTLLRGNKKEVVIQKLHPGFRTEAQFDKVRELVNHKDFDFCCGQVFTPESSKSRYRGPFMFMWYDKKGKLHGIKIGARGEVLREVAASKFEICI